MRESSTQAAPPHENFVLAPLLYGSCLNSVATDGTEGCIHMTQTTRRPTQCHAPSSCTTVPLQAETVWPAWHSRPGEEGGHPFEVRGAFLICREQRKERGRSRMKGKGRRKKDRRDQARPAQRKVPSAIRVEPVEPSSPLESMNSEEQEHVPFPFDDDTESMNSDEEAEQWTNLPPKCFQMQEQTSSIQKSQEK